MLHRFRPFAAFLAVSLFFPCLADAGVDTVKTPQVKEGVLDFKYKSKYEHDGKAKLDGNRETEFGLTYGITRDWKTDVEAGFADKKGAGFQYKKMKIQNYYNFAGEAEGALASAALYAEAAVAGDGSGESHTFSWGVVASKKIFDATTHTGNLLLRHDFGDTARDGVNVILRTQSRYDISPHASPALEIFYDSQKSTVWQGQSLRIGPALSGKLPFEGAAGRIGYDFGYFFGITPGAPDGTLRWILKYEF